MYVWQVAPAVEGLIEHADITTPGSEWYQKPEQWALQNMRYFSCYNCTSPFFGGMRLCGAAGQDTHNPEELLCAACLPPSVGVTVCPKHGSDYIEFKCRYCCSAASWYCWG